jgi:5'-3' exonuclease
VPIILRHDEKYICPQEDGWENRYYKALFGIVPSESTISEIERNYKSGLEWVYKYYTSEEVDMYWRYEYEYGPLMKDMKSKNEKREIGSKEVLSEKEQLMYVMPYENLYLVGEKGEEKKEKYKELYPQDYEFKWGYCRYFWEAHPILPEITIEMLKNMNR